MPSANTDLLLELLSPVLSLTCYFLLLLNKIPMQNGLMGNWRSEDGMLARSSSSDLLRWKVQGALAGPLPLSHSTKGLPSVQPTNRTKPFCFRFLLILLNLLRWLWLIKLYKFWFPEDERLCKASVSLMRFKPYVLLVGAEAMGLGRAHSYGHMHLLNCDWTQPHRHAPTSESASWQQLV